MPNFTQVKNTALRGSSAGKAEYVTNGQLEIGRTLCNVSFGCQLESSNKTGMPDLILTKPNEVRWVEVKAEEGRLSPVQE